MKSSQHLTVFLFPNGKEGEESIASLRLDLKVGVLGYLINLGLEKGEVL
jgi:hypothetical protein